VRLAGGEPFLLVVSKVTAHTSWLFK